MLGLQYWVHVTIFFSLIGLQNKLDKCFGMQLVDLFVFDCDPLFYAFETNIGQIMVMVVW